VWSWDDLRDGPTAPAYLHQAVPANLHEHLEHTLKEPLFPDL
jgi:hypothetical protein